MLLISIYICATISNKNHHKFRYRPRFYCTTCHICSSCLCLHQNF